MNIYETIEEAQQEFLNKGYIPSSTDYNGCYAGQTANANSACYISQTIDGFVLNEEHFTL